MSAFLYILLLDNQFYYTGSTTNLEKRLDEHWSGNESNYTKKHKPIKIVYVEEFESIRVAYEREQQVKGWSRAKKEALIKGDFNKLVELSKNYKIRFGGVEDV